MPACSYRVLFVATQRVEIGADMDSDALPNNEGADDEAANTHPERPADSRGARAERVQQRAT